MTQRLYVFAMVILAVVAVLVLATTPASADDWFVLDELNVEGAIVKPLAPDLTLNLGLSASWEVLAIPDDFAIFAGRSVFLDALYIIDDNSSGAFLGTSLELINKTRVGVAVWKEDNVRWTIYAIQPLLTF